MDGLVLHGGKEKVTKSFPFEKKNEKKNMEVYLCTVMGTFLALAIPFETDLIILYVNYMC